MAGQGSRRKRNWRANKIERAMSERTQLLEAERRRAAEREIALELFDEKIAAFLRESLDKWQTEDGAQEGTTAQETILDDGRGIKFDDRDTDDTSISSSAPSPTDSTSQLRLEKSWTWSVASESSASQYASTLASMSSLTLNGFD